MQKINYKPEIDGLRAIAVMVVIFFHYEVSFFSGGFVGVDVFFVISGFLITQLIHENSLSNSFSFGDFYHRRVRRLFPAFFFTVLSTFIFAFYILSPAHLERLGGASLYSMLGISNYFFWLESGYFDVGAIYKPLLHTWSLAVEEQFYLLWPLFIYILSKKFSSRITIVSIIAISCISLYLSYLKVQDNSSTAFYLAPYRIFEFGIGAIVFFALKNQLKTNDNAVHFGVRELTFFIGLLLVFYAVFTFKKTTLFPGLNALIPTLGAALIIYSGPTKYFGKLLTNPLSIYIGLISYSLYLVHWPIYVLYSYTQLNEVNLTHKILLLIVSLVFASLMHHFVETPFRHKKSNTQKTTSPFLLTCSLLALLVTLPFAHSWAKEGWQWRMEDSIRYQLGQSFGKILERNAEIRSERCHMNKEGQNWEAFLLNFNECNDIKDNSIMVLGDSHAADVWAGLNANYPKQNSIQLTGAGCSISSTQKKCIKLFEYAQKIIKQHPLKIKKIYYTERGKKSFANNKNVISEGLKKTKNYLQQLKTNHNQVLWLGPHMEFNPDIPTLLSLSLSTDDFYLLAHSKQKNWLFELDEKLKHITENTTIQYVSKLDNLCSNKKCLLTDDRKTILYPDYGHWTPDGGAFIVKKIFPSPPL